MNKTMPTQKLLTDTEVSANPRLRAVFDDIRATRKSDFINNFWRALANQPDLLERTWANIKQVMFAPAEPAALEPLTKELIYIAVSVTNNCSYCIHSHTAAARSGTIENAKMPSEASRSSLNVLYLLAPAKRASRSTGTPIRR